MLPDRVSNPGPLTYESGALPIALRGPANLAKDVKVNPRYSLKHSWAKLFTKSYELAFSHV